MNPRKVSTVIDTEKCVGCGLCIRVCPSETLTLENGKARVTGDRSLSCGHCAAVCPSDAVTVQSLDPSMLQFQSFDLEEKWLPHGQGDGHGLARLMASRRSCRNFKERPVPLPILEDLVKFGTLAPSGTNSQEWTFTILSDRKAVLNFGNLIKTFFVRLNQMASKTWLRKGLSLLGKKDLENYFKEYYESVSQAMTEMETTGRDRLFHGATACILVGTGPEASCPKEDALLAAGNMLLAAHTLGLGTCLVGFAVSAMNADPSVGKKLGIPAKETIHAVIAVGYPDETYLRISGRKRPIIRSC